MATFPTLNPSSRTYTPGEYPHTPFSAYSGFQNRVRHSNVMLASQLRLGFIALTEAQMLSVLSHYQGQFGSYESFDLPTDVWSGVSTVSDYNLAGYFWRYIEPPTVEDVYCDRYNVECALETVPPDGANVDGAWMIVAIDLATTGAAAASGLNRSVTLTLAAVGFATSGFDGTITQSLTAGAAAASSGSTFTVTSLITADGTAASSGADLSVTLSLLPGEATGGTAAPSDYWADMAAQMFGWESLAYIEWWGN